MNDRYFDEVIRVKLEAMMDASVVDETALEEVLDVADKLNVSHSSWWSQMSSGFTWNTWLIGALSGLAIAGICWWVLAVSEPTPLQVQEVPEKVVISFPEEEILEKEADNEVESPVILPLMPDTLLQDKKNESTRVADSLPLFQEEEVQKKKMVLPMIKQLKKMPIVSIAEIKEIPLKPVPLSLTLSPRKKSQTEPPTYHSPSHPNKKRTSTTRPPTYILKRK